jgi:REP element-mobilizing transposase RayT
MPNHYHFIFKCGQDWSEIPRLMQAYMTAYATYYNRKYLKVRRLFQAPFQIKILNSRKDLESEIEYIKNNPPQDKQGDYPWLYIKR